VKVALVFNALALLKDTAAGPETRVQLWVSAAGGLGRPSSAAAPFSVAVAGLLMVTLWSAPALLVGDWLLVRSW
jgi:hypothetical protein